VGAGYRLPGVGGVGEVDRRHIAPLMFGTLTYRWMTCGPHIYRVHQSAAPRHNGVRQRIPVRTVDTHASTIVTSQNVGQFRGRIEGLLCIASEITGFFFRAFVSKT
jgi:hypothetical protein